MNEILIFYTVLLILAFTGISVFKVSISEKKKFVVNKKGYLNIKNLFYNEKDNEEINSLFKKSEIGLTYIKYQIIRAIVLLGILIFIAYSYLSNKLSGNIELYKLLGFLVMLAIITHPKLYLRKRETPFFMIVKSIGKKAKAKKNIEIYRAVSQLKNISLIYENKAPGAIFILEQLRMFTNTIRVVFNTMMKYWERNEKEKACSYFENEIGTPQAKRFVEVLKKLDDLSPSQLFEQLELFQESVRGDRQTAKMNKDQSISNLVWFLVFTSGLIVILNFVIINYLYNLHLMQYLY